MQQSGWGKQKYLLGKRKQKKGQGRSHLWKAEGGSHMLKKMGTGLRSGTARFLTGSLPSAPWEVRFSALQTHEGHHLLQLEGQPLFPGCIILLQWTHNLPAGQWGKHRHTKTLQEILRIAKMQSQNLVHHNYNSETIWCSNVFCTENHLTLNTPCKLKVAMKTLYCSFLTALVSVNSNGYTKKEYQNIPRVFANHFCKMIPFCALVY